MIPPNYSDIYSFGDMLHALNDSEVTKSEVNPPNKICVGDDVDSQHLKSADSESIDIKSTGSASLIPKKSIYVGDEATRITLDLFKSIQDYLVKEDLQAYDSFKALNDRYANDKKHPFGNLISEQINSFRLEQMARFESEVRSNARKGDNAFASRVVRN